MKFGAFFLTYNRPEILTHTLEIMLQQTCIPDFILVVDNGNSAETKSIIENRFSSSTIVGYEATSGNLGSAGGTAYGFRRLYALGFDLIYCGDDDDPPKTPDTIARLMSIIAMKGEPGGVGAVGAKWNWHKGELIRLSDEQLKDTVEVDMIGGGQQLILHREIISAVGVPNDDFFFGYPDLEYSLRIRRAGYPLWIDGDLMHEYRAQTGRLNLKRRRSIMPHRAHNNIWRNYYTTRNYIYMMQYVFGRPDLARKGTYKSLFQMLTAWGRGPKYATEFSSLQLRGIIDGYRGRLGRNVTPRPKYATAR
ncbi:MAG: glycosyltransferase [Caldilineaceae bacterium]